MWSQADRASVAYCYFQYNVPFFIPQTLNVVNETGNTGVEFPIVYFLVAQLYKIFGHSDFIFRLFVFLINLNGIIAAINLLASQSRSKIYPALFIGLIILSPVYIFYSYSYLPDIVAFSLMLISINFYFKFKLKQKYFLAFLFFFFATLSSLIKISFAIFPLAILLSQLFDNKNPFKFKINLYISLLTLFGVMLSITWYLYSSYLNKKYNGIVFMMSAKDFPTIEEFKFIFKNSYKYWAAEFLSPLSAFLILIIYSIIVWNWKSIDRFIRGLIIFSHLGSLFYVLFFFSQFLNHDYYYILFYGNIFILLLALSYINFWELANKKMLVTFVVLLLLVNLGYSYTRINDRYEGTIKYSGLLGDQSMYKLIGFDKILDNHKIPRDKRFIVFYDYSLNISLYYIGRPGIPVNYKWDNNFIANFLNRKDIEYVLLINSDGLINSDLLNDRLGDLVVQQNDLKVYKLLH